MASRDFSDSVTFSRKAREDLAAIYDHTAHTWGSDQAEEYWQFLHTKTELLAQNPKIGEQIQDREEARIFLAKWRQARYGHFIVYFELPKGIYILRIIHSAMDLHSHLKSVDS